MDNERHEYQVRSSEEKKMRKVLFGTIFALSTLVGTACAAPPPARHAPDFTIIISTEAGTFTAQNGPIVVSVVAVEKNISTHIVDITRTRNPDESYEMTVTLDGRPAPLTDEYKRKLAPKPYDPNELIMGDTFIGALKPDQSAKFIIPLSDYFDFSAPGRYEITFSRGTDEGKPDSVEVKSNTITITVLPADEPATTK
jgi:hypothetical protein